jgi:hypothetical protein
MMLAAGPYSLPFIQEAMEAGWQGDFPARPAGRAAGVHLLQHAQDHDLRRLQRSAAQHRLAGRSRLTGSRKTDSMDFDFTDDQEQLRDAVRKWVDKGYDFERRRGIAKAGGFSREAYGQIAELGLTGLYIPEADGGLGMGPVEGMVVMEELGRGIVLEPFAQGALMAGAVLAGYAPAAVKAAWLPKIAGGEAWWCWPTRNARALRLKTCDDAGSAGRRRLDR